MRPTVTSVRTGDPKTKRKLKARGRGERQLANDGGQAEGEVMEGGGGCVGLLRFCGSGYAGGHELSKTTGNAGARVWRGNLIHSTVPLGL
nr:hypothetical protein Iba_chr14cCG2810 [Ipomoea batatas]